MLGGGAGGAEGGGTGLGLDDLSAVIQSATVGLVLFSAAVVAVRRAASRYFVVDGAGFAASSVRPLPDGEPAGAAEQGTTAADLTWACAACGVVSYLRCSACKRVRYCSKKCQLKHWKIDHKFNCKQMKSKDLAADSELRRYETQGRSFASDDEEQHSSFRLDDPRTHGFDNESIQTQGMVKHSSHQHVQCDPQKKISQMLENSGKQGIGTEMQQDHSKTINLLGQEFSMTRCLAVLKDMVDLSDDVKIQASEVFKDALNREIFLGYETRLRALWLIKEVNKLAVLSNAS